MIPAIHARRSTEQTGVSEDQKSVTPQIKHGKAYAQQKGWLVSEDLIFVDDTSGAKFERRPRTPGTLSNPQRRFGSRRRSTLPFR